MLFQAIDERNRKLAVNNVSFSNHNQSVETECYSVKAKLFNLIYSMHCSTKNEYCPIVAKQPDQLICETNKQTNKQLHFPVIYSFKVDVRSR